MGTLYEFAMHSFITAAAFVLVATLEGPDARKDLMTQVQWWSRDRMLIRAAQTARVATNWGLCILAVKADQRATVTARRNATSVSDRRHTQRMAPSAGVLA